MKAIFMPHEIFGMAAMFIVEIKQSTSQSKAATFSYRKNFSIKITSFFRKQGTIK